MNKEKMKAKAFAYGLLHILKYTLLITMLIVILSFFTSCSKKPIDKDVTYFMNKHPRQIQSN